jgi:hypothetical protein
MRLLPQTGTNKSVSSRTTTGRGYFERPNWPKTPPLLTPLSHIFGLPPGRGSMPLLGGGHRLVLRCWGLSCLNWRRKYHAIRVTARSLAGEVQGLEPTVGRLGPMVATESSVPPVFPTDGRMTLVSSWTTLCRGEFGSRHGTKKDATFSRGTQAPLSFEFGLPEGQTPRDEIVGHHFGAKNSMFFHAIISNCPSREREGGLNVASLCLDRLPPRERAPIAAARF